MSAVRTLRDSLLALLPRWLLDDVGMPLNYAFGLILDGVEDWIYQAVRARYVDHTPVGQTTGAPEDALPYLGQDRQIVRGFSELSPAYRIRLRASIDVWRHAGSAYAILSELAGYFSPSTLNMTIVSVLNVWNWITSTAPQFSASGYPVNRYDASAAGNWLWSASIPSWSSIWVIIYSPGTPWASEGTWGDGAVWGDGGTWGSTATLAQVSTLRSIVKQWRPLRTTVVNILLSFASPATEFSPLASFGSPTLPDGNWLIGTKYVGGIPVQSRVLNGAAICDFAIFDGVQ